MIHSIHGDEIAKIEKVVSSGSSVLLVGESGSGRTTVLNRIVANVGHGFKGTAIATYTGTAKPLITSICEQLGCPTTTEKYDRNGDIVGEKDMSVEEMKAEILSNCSGYLICADNADRWSSSLRYWLGLLLDGGAILICTALTNPQRDVFLKLVNIELSAPSVDQIRDVMYREAITLNLELSPSLFARLQSKSGTNLMLAKKVVVEESLGISNHAGEHRNYIDISPFVNALLTGLGIIRFVGLGTGDRSLYIFGGIAMLLAISFRYLGKGFAKQKRVLGK